MSSHEWKKKENDYYIVGLTAQAIEEIGEIDNIKFPEIGKKVTISEEVCIVESAKSAVEVYSPIDGIVIEINKELKNDLNLLNHDPENKGWLFKIRPSFE